MGSDARRKKGRRKRGADGWDRTGQTQNGGGNGRAAERERAGPLADEWGRPVGRVRMRTARRDEAGVGVGLRKWAASGKGGRPTGLAAGLGFPLWAGLGLLPFLFLFLSNSSSNFYSSSTKLVEFKVEFEFNSNTQTSKTNAPA